MEGSGCEIEVLDSEDCERGFSPRHGAAVPGEVMRRVGKWIPVFTAWNDDNHNLQVLAVEDVDPGRLQCKAYVAEPGRNIRIHKLRFTNPEVLQLFLDSAGHCAPADRHHRCSCCLEWIYRCASLTCS